MLKVKPHPDYPPEEGRYVRGNDASPVAAVVILNCDADKSLIDQQFEGNPDFIRQAVWSCYQEEPVKFGGYTLYDPGAFPEPPLSGKITMRVTQPWIEQPDERERDAVKKAKALIERLKTKAKEKSS